eukprot:179993_1
MAGPYHNCALSTTNTMKCWGMNLYGQLGYGDTNNRGDVAGEMGDNLPEVDLGSNICIAQIEVGYRHTCVVSNANKVKCWGYAQYGRLGYGDEDNRGNQANEMGDNLPEVDLGSNFNSIRIALGDYHTCVISSSNTVKCYGYNDSGQLGYCDTEERGDQVNEMGENLPEIDIGIGFATQSPTQSPTTPTTSPSLSPTSAPSAPSAAPSIHPSAQPSGVTLYPTMSPSLSPTAAPSAPPSIPPTMAPSLSPTSTPSAAPTMAPSNCYENDGRVFSINEKLSSLKFNKAIIDNVTSFVLENEFNGKPLLFENIHEQQVVCSGAAACYGSNMSFSNMNTCNLLCDGVVSCSSLSVYIEECKSSEIICNGLYSCDRMTVTMNSSSSDVLKVHCGVETSCNKLELNVFGNSVTETSCIGLNACDGMKLNVEPNNYKNSQLEMLSYSDDVLFSNGFGYEELNGSAQYVQCHELSTYIEWNQSATSNAQVTPLILNEYEGERFPCDSVKIECFQANNSEFVSSCDMRYTVKAEEFTASPSPLAQCNWVEVHDIIEISCDGDCSTSPTLDPTTSPTSSPTEPTINPSEHPTNNPSEQPTAVPTVDPTIDPTIDPTNDPTVDPTMEPTKDPTVDPTTDPTTVP